MSQSHSQVVQKPSGDLRLSNLDIGGWHIAQPPNKWPNVGSQPGNLLANAWAAKNRPCYWGSIKGIDLKPLPTNHGGRILIEHSRVGEIYDRSIARVGHYDLIYAATDAKASPTLAFNDIVTCDCDGGHFLFDFGSGILMFKNWRVQGKCGYGFPFNITLFSGCQLKCVFEDCDIRGVQFVAKGGCDVDPGSVLKGIWINNCKDLSPVISLFNWNTRQQYAVRPIHTFKNIPINKGVPPVWPYNIAPTNVPITVGPTRKYTDISCLRLINRNGSVAAEYPSPIGHPGSFVFKADDGFDYTFDKPK